MTSEATEETFAQQIDADEERDAERYYEFRCAEVRKLKAEREHFPYPHSFDETHTISSLVAEFQPRVTAKGEFLEGEVAVAGRVRAIRTAGKNLVFLDVTAGTAKVQIMANASMYADRASFNRMCETIRRGDIVGVKGRVGLSRAGEFSLAPNSIQLLSPCLHILPKKYNELTDVETRYRQRYLDLMVNTKPREVFLARSNIISTLRAELIQRDYIEVETPMLGMLAGGATAKPFTTLHADLNIEMFLRVAPELYLKRCLVGGFDRVFEIGKSFRNEGIDRTHNPEFTTVELYTAYQDYEGGMRLLEEVLTAIVQRVKGSLQFTLEQRETSVPIDFSRPWKRINMMEELARLLGEPMPEDLESPAANAFFLEACARRNLNCPPPTTTARLIDKLVGALIEPQLVNPTFLCEQPQLMSPLAKFHRSKAQLTERFELFINGCEYANAYTELNDPFQQRELFEEQMRARVQGDDEAQPCDMDYVTALEYGMPPACGVGIGIDRLTMLLTNSSNIQDVILFPAMKPKLQTAAKEETKELCSAKGGDAVVVDCTQNCVEKCTEVCNVNCGEKCAEVCGEKCAEVCSVKCPESCADICGKKCN